MKDIFKNLFTILGFLSSIILLLEVLTRRYRSTEEKLEYLGKEETQDPIAKIIQENQDTLNVRQVKILELFKEKDVLYPSEIYEVLPEVSTRTIRRDMTALANLDLVEQIGSTRDTYYLLSSEYEV